MVRRIYVEKKEPYAVRAKELLALIVDRRGGMVSAQDAFSSS